jgi:hypothetical protein
MPLTQPAPSIVAWNSSEGKKRLQESRYNLHFYQLAHLFERQAKPTYCGVASAVMVMNALRLPKKGLTLETRLDVKVPDAKQAKRLAYNSYSQLTFLDAQTSKIKKKSEVEGKFVAGELFDPGMDIETLAKKLRLSIFNVKVVHASATNEKALNQFRQDVMAFMNDRETYMIANFDTFILGRQGGHYSPVAAYHSASDSCLVMDVGGHKHPWFWVSVEDFVAAMHTKDGQLYRGYMLVSDRL